VGQGVAGAGTSGRPVQIGGGEHLAAGLVGHQHEDVSRRAGGSRAAGRHRSDRRLRCGARHWRDGSSRPGSRHPHRLAKRQRDDDARALGDGYDEGGVERQRFAGRRGGRKKDGGGLARHQRDVAEPHPLVVHCDLRGGRRREKDGESETGGAMEHGADPSRQRRLEAARSISSVAVITLEFIS
jgi:hypothetical protein